MRKLIPVFLIFCWAGNMVAQKDDKFIVGKVSYMSMLNVYVKFESTKSLAVGDTLFMLKENKRIPVLVVNNLSSTSCVCTPISTNNFSVSMEIYAKSFVPKSNNENKLKVIIPTVNKSKGDTLKSSEVKKKPEFEQKIYGSISASSYSNFSDVANINSTRFRYQFSLNARNIANSKFSVETYVSFQHQKDNWKSIQENVYQALKIYNLSIKYDDKKTLIVFGRKINPNISSMGAIDGIQYEGKSDKFFWGAIAGSRPSYTDYSFDFSLYQFGAYVGHKYSNSKGEMQNSFALVEQMNGTKTDRRFAYYQQSNSLLKNLYFFGSVEFDLYKNIDSIPKSTFDLSSAYLVLNYKLSKRITLSTSYDSRKNIIYYETYKNYLNQMLEMQARQGLSFQANYYNLKNLTFGFRAGYRFPNNNSKETINLYGFISYYNIPGIKLNATGSVNYLETSYLNGKILDVRISRTILQVDLYIDCGYQYVDYSYVGTETTFIQNVIDLSINWIFFKKISFSVNYEKTFEKQNQFDRLNLQIRKRF